MRCPKCQSLMQEHPVDTQSGKVFIDKCKRCSGLWFDRGEAEKLREGWTPLSLDDGSKSAGRLYNEITEIDCPRCLRPMKSVSDPNDPAIRYEVCPEHGIFMDAGEFSDYRETSLQAAFDRLLNLNPKGGASVSEPDGNDGDGG